MPNRTVDDEKEKVDHSSHPTSRRTPGDLRAPGAGASERPNQSDDSRDGVSQPEPVTPPDRDNTKTPAEKRPGR